MLSCRGDLNISSRYYYLLGEKIVLYLELCYVVDWIMGSRDDSPNRGDWFTEAAFESKNAFYVRSCVLFRVFGEMGTNLSTPSRFLCSVSGELVLSRGARSLPLPRVWVMRQLSLYSSDYSSELSMYCMSSSSRIAILFPCWFSSINLVLAASLKLKGKRGETLAADSSSLEVLIEISRRFLACYRI